MSGILRLSHAEIRVPDIELGLAYYAEVVGLVEVAHRRALTSRDGTSTSTTRSC